MDIEGIESALSLCIKALKILHPDMDENEPCIAYEAYMSAKWALRSLESQDGVAYFSVIDPNNKALLSHTFNTLISPILGKAQ